MRGIVFQSIINCKLTNQNLLVALLIILLPSELIFHRLGRDISHPKLYRIPDFQYLHLEIQLKVIQQLSHPAFSEKTLQSGTSNLLNTKLFPCKLVELSLPQGYPSSHVKETEKNNGER